MSKVVWKCRKTPERVMRVRQIQKSRRVLVVTAGAIATEKRKGR